MKRAVQAVQKSAKEKPKPIAKKRRKVEIPPAKSDALKAKGQKIYKILEDLYPNESHPLEHENPFQLLVSTLLSAQTTDKMVNQCTPALFKKAPDVESMAKLEVDEILECVKKVGLAPTKSKNISLLSKVAYKTGRSVADSGLSQMLVEKHGGKVPDTFEDLEALPGVGHKTASIVMIFAFGKTAFPVDTHVHRLAARWGLSSGKSVTKTEEDLKMIFPEDQWNDTHLRIVLFGREHCPAKNHDPKTCAICSWAGKKEPKDD